MWTTNDLGRSSKPNQMDYKRVRLIYDCLNNEEQGEKWDLDGRVEEINVTGDCDYYTLSYEEYGDCITMQNQCKTVDGAPCVFPFMFRGKEVANCISTPKRIRPWCPTQIDSSIGVPVRGQWGYCDDQCPTERSEIGNLSEIKI